MDPEQIGAEMKATRERIDHRLHVIQTRVSKSRGRLGRVALAGSVLISSLFYLWGKRRWAHHQQSRAGRG